MGDQNRFEEYRQKLLQYWGAFLAFCGQLWEKAKVNGKKAAAFLASHAKALVQWIAACLVKAVEFAKAQAQKFAAWLLKLREDLQKEDSLPNRAKAWCGGLIARLRAPKSPEILELPQQEESRNVVELPPEPAEPVEAVAEAPVEVQPMVVQAEEHVVQAVQREAEVPAEEKSASTLDKIRGVLRTIAKWVRRLYKFVMAAPVVYAAVKLALQNLDRLPDQVGLDIQATGEFTYMVSREMAVWGPVGITAFCLALMFCAKKPLLPWVISMFTLVLPVLIWITNYYA